MEDNFMRYVEEIAKMHESKAADYVGELKHPLQNYMAPAILGNDPVKYMLNRIAEKCVRVSNLRAQKRPKNKVQEDMIDIAVIALLLIDIYDEDIEFIGRDQLAKTKGICSESL